ncbi:MAG TPA: hypothetical protein DHV08_13990 [Rhodocyclaceae bacterium]|nr:MAG: hypothetical protein AUK49_06600 [Betaproteobacteria bacterium CG2_30_68_42]PIV71446.1 MAG: hypothetical protein COW56_14855 [Rhodocyclales bacterium CG17_big_fil_post_rev_8_21_14_2_50_68_7]PIX75405.1 MAG: hypothetical protein COZ38_05775 [Rhodocyclales bacterium CG_4_10_14_3_um_filter_68_10]PJA58162.1 MAG: hypothetical protein CO164_04015 [Rhodocyclales bacterium CG_4_9_14_3_um_filter_68_10]HCX34535.1 hypothetical protein [Rhodocyclaceae bacterium]
MLFIASTIKLLAEVVGWCLIGQGIVYLFAGARREQNIPYRILSTITSPLTRAVRIVTPRFVLDRHIGLLAFLVVVMIWYWAAQYKLALCLSGNQAHPLCVEMVKKLGARTAQ